MARTATTTRRPRRTKAEIQQEFAELQEDVTKEGQETDAKAESFQKLKEAETRQAVEEFPDRLRKEIEKARADAVKAIEGASGARALTHVNEIAMEQAKQRAQKA